MASKIQIGFGSPRADSSSGAKYTVIDLLDPIGPTNEWEIVSGSILGYNRGTLTESGGQLYLHSGGGSQPQAILQSLSLFDVPPVGTTGPGSVLGVPGRFEWKILSVL